ncbi:MAG: PilN domain-containing protein [Eubacteriales bacterium]
MKNRINLLNPSTSTTGKSTPEGHSRLLVIICILLVLITVGTYGTILGLELQAQNKTAQARKDLTGRESAEQQGEIKENLVAQRDVLSADIETLKAGKPKLSNYLDELKAVTPLSVVLTNLQITDKPFGVTIKGIAPSPLVIAQFERNLQESVYFKNSMISSGEKRGNDSFYEFVITVTPARKGGSN